MVPPADGDPPKDSPAFSGLIQIPAQGLGHPTRSGPCDAPSHSPPFSLALGAPGALLSAEFEWVLLLPTSMSLPAAPSV